MRYLIILMVYIISISSLMLRKKSSLSRRINNLQNHLCNITH
jgi:hypothetical protein